MQRVIYLLLVLLVMNSLDHLVEPRHTVVVMVDDMSPAYPLNEQHELFDIFDRYGVKPTLFIIPNHAGQNPLPEHPEWSALIRRKIAEGYQVGVHGYEHTSWEFYNLTRSQADEKIARGMSEFEQALGLRPKLFRAPNMAVLPQTHESIEAWGLRDASKVIGHEYTWYATNLGNKVSLFHNSLGDEPYVLLIHLHAANTEVGLAFLDYALSYFRASDFITLEEYLDKHDTGMEDYLRGYEREHNT